MRWYVPFNQLSVSQRNVLDGITRQLQSSHWVQGFAGTGKTVVVAHLIERVAADKPNASLCFITFTHALKDLVATGFHGPVEKRVDIKTHTKFLSERKKYDYVFLDEVQDISANDLNRIKALSENLYIAGDPDQRIYPAGAAETEILESTQSVQWKLLEIFRLTKLLRDVAISILPKAKIVEGSDAVKTANVTIRRLALGGFDAEVEWVWKEALKRALPGHPSVVLFPTHKAIAKFASQVATNLNISTPPLKKSNREDGYDLFNKYWKQKEVSLSYLGNGQGSLAESDTKPSVYFMTYHSSKGLDFKNVFIPGLNEDLQIVYQPNPGSDPELPRRLLFVAVTRSRENLFLSYNTSKPHSYVAELPKGVLTEVELSKVGKPTEEDFF